MVVYFVDFGNHLQRDFLSLSSDSSPSKRPRYFIDSQADNVLLEPLGLPQDEAPPEMILNFINTKFNSCLSRAVRDSISGSYSKFDVPSLKTPEADKDVVSILGKHFPSKEDKRLAAVQSAILASSAPLLSLMSDLISQGFSGKSDELIPVEEVFKVGKESLALIGNAAHLTTLKRRAGIVEAVKPKRPKLAAFLDETCLSETAVEEPSSELFGPTIKKKIAERAATIKSFNDSVLSIDDPPKGRDRFLGRGSTAKYGGSSNALRKPYNSQRSVFRPRRQFQRNLQQQQGHRKK